MSQADLERFITACEKDAFLREELAGLGDRPEAWVRRARELGYELTPDEAAGLISGTAELSDEELEEVAGGWDEGSGGDGGGGGEPGGGG